MGGIGPIEPVSSGSGGGNQEQPKQPPPPPNSGEVPPEQVEAGKISLPPKHAPTSENIANGIPYQNGNGGDLHIPNAIVDPNVVAGTLLVGGVVLAGLLLSSGLGVPLAAAVIAGVLATGGAGTPPASAMPSPGGEDDGGSGDDGGGVSNPSGGFPNPGGSGGSGNNPAANFGPEGAGGLVSPLVLDLDGDGIETTALGGSMFFDHDANGRSEQTAWVAGDDGLLFLDRNDDSIVNNGTELFGDHTPLSAGGTAADGFAALADLDTNHNGKIDEDDADFNNLKVLKGDGTAYTLSELDIKSLNLSYSTVDVTDISGNLEKYRGSFEKLDGTVQRMSDVYFQTNPTNSISTDLLEVPSDIQKLPNYGFWQCK